MAQIQRALDKLRDKPYDFHIEDFNELIESKNIFIKYLEEYQINLVLSRGMREGDEVKKMGAIEEIDRIVQDLGNLDKMRDTILQNQKDSVDKDKEVI